MEYNLAEKRITPNIRTILEDRYLRKNTEGKIIETPDQMYLRVAKHIANGNEKLVDKYYTIMAEGKFQPNSPCLAIAGIDGKGCLSACFVRSPQDTLEDIMKVVSDAAMIEKWGGGIGFGVSNLREKDAPIKTTHGKALGAIETLKILSYNASKITQGSFRRGAHMGQMLVSHPEILAFIHCKDTFEELQNFNISVQITDEFMTKVLNDESWDLISPYDGRITATIPARTLWDDICKSAHATGDPGIAFIDRVWETQPNPQLGDIMTSNPCVSQGTLVGDVLVEDIKVGDIIPCFDLKNGLVYDTADSIEIHENFPIYYVECTFGKGIYVTQSHKFLAYKGSGEFPTFDRDFYRLDELVVGDSLITDDGGSSLIFAIEFAGYATVYDIKNNKYDTWITNNFVSQGCGEEYLEDGNSCCLGSINLSKFVINGKWDYIALDSIVHTAVEFLNGVIDVNEFPLQSLRDINLATRRIGLGVMGWADALIALGIPYDSSEAIEEARKVGAAISASAWDESAILAEKDGPFPEWKNSALNTFGAKPVRNSSVITIAPTGTISRLADCSSGIEPLFDLVWESNILWKDDGGENTTKVLDCAKGIKEAIIKYDEEQRSLGQSPIDVLQTFKSKPKELLAFLHLDDALYQTALEISPQNHVKMQVAWQENTSNAVSKTINCPNEITVDEIKDIYMEAWRLNCKGITIYRSGTRELEVLAKVNDSDVEVATDSGIDEEKIPAIGNIKRPHSIFGVTDEWHTGHGNLLVTANWNGKPHEIISTAGKAGGCDTAYLETIARLISLALQKGVNYEDIAYQMNGITCCPMWDDGQLILSPADAIAKTMRTHFGKVVDKKEAEEKIITHTLIESENSKKCHACNGRMISLSGCPTCESCGLGKCD